MIIIKIADINFKINNHYKYIDFLCKDYITNSDEFQYEISITKEDLIYEIENSPEKFSNAYFESVAILRKITLILPKHNAFTLHAACIRAYDKAYAFSAPSGTGKTTHINLWLKLLGDDASVINGDKPIIRLIDGVPYAYGNPWNGKEGMGENVRYPLKALCFIKRSPNNYIEEISRVDAVKSIIKQIYIPDNEKDINTIFNYIEELLKVVKVYELHCNMDIEAAEVAYNKMK